MAWSRVEGENDENDENRDSNDAADDELEAAAAFPGCPSLYLLADCPATNALYVAFRGTKVQTDFLALADVAPLSPPWPGERGMLEAALPFSSLLPSSSPGVVGGGKGKGTQQQQQQLKCSAHRGFARRAAEIPIEAIAAHAASRRRRLVVSWSRRLCLYRSFFFLEREREREKERERERDLTRT